MMRMIWNNKPEVACERDDSITVRDWVEMCSWRELPKADLSTAGNMPRHKFGPFLVDISMRQGEVITLEVHYIRLL